MSPMPIALEWTCEAGIESQCPTDLENYKQSNVVGAKQAQIIFQLYKLRNMWGQLSKVLESNRH